MGCSEKVGFGYPQRSELPDGETTASHGQVKSQKTKKRLVEKGIETAEPVARQARRKTNEPGEANQTRDLIPPRLPV